MRSGFFNSNGVRIHYADEGEGDAIVLVHGFAASLDGNWVRTRWFEALRELRRVVALDCRGHGGSDKPHDPEAYALEAMSGDVVRLMDHLGIERADLFGYSMGSRVALRAVTDRPERFTSLVLGGTGMRRGRRTNVADAMQSGDPASIEDPVAKGFRAFAEAGKNDLDALAAVMRAPFRELDPARLAEIELPVLIVNGQNDAIVHNVEGLAASIPGARLVKILGKDHLTVVPDQRFKDAVVQFLQRAR